MSLIDEALRRLQDPLIPKTPQSPPSSAPPQQPTQHEPPSSVHSWPVKPVPIPVETPLPASSLFKANSLLAVALAVLVLTVILIVGGAFWMGRALQTQGQTAPMTSAPPPDAKLEMPQDSTPTRSLPSPKRKVLPPSDTDRFTLSGVAEGGAPYAVINGTIVGVGEHIGDATLLEIVNGAVKIRRADGTETVLRVPR